ncbi:hypothetical protein VE01_02740 [Pseudogymnoascus verrucosus]|uniref:Uncharacterized protein n=1 Tax=Pseudogymnoascus verrucosus TaxID=342668 RepID=A0A1B8GTU4_9PEZI|nr:uncharacterized protein VE01_02740 [Pseudogymnoascus verrucosus]OBT99230.1 hypothetical protein VE01_02740 [Pseudogymnoascus verrucosus]
MSTYAFSIITCDRGEQWDSPTKMKPYHWVFWIQSSTTPNVGHTFQLRGMPGTFYHSAEEAVDLSKLDGANGRLEVGSIPLQKYELYKQLLQEVTIDNVESSGWNCQNWSLAALDNREQDLVADDYSNNVIRHWLSEDQ